MKYALNGSHIVTDEGKVTPDGTPAPVILATIYDEQRSAELVAAANEADEHPLVIASRAGRRMVDLKHHRIRAEAQAAYWWWGFMASIAWSCEKTRLFIWCARRAERYAWAVKS